MAWSIRFCTEFLGEFERFEKPVKKELLAHLKLLELRGPALGRPSVDTLKGARHSNMKELRFTAGDGVWRVAFAFDPMRQAILLVAADKAGVSENRFYRSLIRRADDRFDRHLLRGEDDVQDT
nr:type II toxin-antitoxin system RelE/ParE family toxin [Pseudomonas sp. BGr12]